MPDVKIPERVTKEWCDGDGYLCFDARGYPYPVAADEFALIYEPTED